MRILFGDGGGGSQAGRGIKFRLLILVPAPVLYGTNLPTALVHLELGHGTSRLESLVLLKRDSCWFRADTESPSAL